MGSVAGVGLLLFNPIVVHALRAEGGEQIESPGRGADIGPFFSPVRPTLFYPADPS